MLERADTAEAIGLNRRASALLDPLRVQAIRSRGQDPRLYVSFPLALAVAIGLEPGEEVQWELLDRGELHLVRPKPTAPSTKSRASH
jgi:hypothetical protein